MTPILGFVYDQPIQLKLELLECQISKPNLRGIIHEENMQILTNITEITQNDTNMTPKWTQIIYTLLKQSRNIFEACLGSFGTIFEQQMTISTNI